MDPSLPVHVPVMLEELKKLWIRFPVKRSSMHLAAAATPWAYRHGLGQAIPALDRDPRRRGGRTQSGPPEHQAGRSPKLRSPRCSRSCRFRRGRHRAHWASSDQLDDAQRASFTRTVPLDSRFDTDSGEPPAAVEKLEATVGQFIFEYGEERHSRRIARNVAGTARSKPFVRPASSPRS